MVKKAKGKKSSVEGSKNEESQREKITEVDKEWFQIQIKSLEEKLERRNEKMRQYELSNKEFEERYIQLREDKADVVAYLKRTLAQRTDQISELSARLEGLQHIHSTDASTYQGKIHEMENELARTKEQLASENMVLTKKLDALEEFRIQREQLMAKFEEQELKVEEQKKEYEGRIYELERAHIIEQDRLKKDMMMKLESVASEFRKASHAQMSATTQRTIRENVNLSAQVVQLSDKVAELSRKTEKMNNEIWNQKQEIGLLNKEKEKLVKRNTYRLKIIEDLAKKCKEQKDQLGKLNSFYGERRQYQTKIEELNDQITTVEKELNESVTASKERDTTVSTMKNHLKGVSRMKEIMNKCLNEANNSIKSALALKV